MAAPPPILSRGAVRDQTREASRRRLGAGLSNFEQDPTDILRAPYAAGGLHVNNSAAVYREFGAVQPHALGMGRIYPISLSGGGAAKKDDHDRMSVKLLQKVEQRNKKEIAKMFRLSEPKLVEESYLDQALEMYRTVPTVATALNLLADYSSGEQVMLTELTPVFEEKTHQEMFLSWLADRFRLLCRQATTDLMLYGFVLLSWSPNARWGCEPKRINPHDVYLTVQRTPLGDHVTRAYLKNARNRKMLGKLFGDAGRLQLPLTSTRWNMHNPMFGYGAVSDSDDSSSESESDSDSDEKQKQKKKKKRSEAKTKDQTVLKAYAEHVVPDGIVFPEPDIITFHDDGEGGFDSATGMPCSIVMNCLSNIAYQQELSDAHIREVRDKPKRPVFVIKGAAKMGGGGSAARAAAGKESYEHDKRRTITAAMNDANGDSCKQSSSFQQINADHLLNSGYSADPTAYGEYEERDGSGIKKNLIKGGPLPATIRAYEVEEGHSVDQGHGPHDLKIDIDLAQKLDEMLTLRLGLPQDVISSSSKEKHHQLSSKTGDEGVQRSMNQAIVRRTIQIKDLFVQWYHAAFGPTIMSRQQDFKASSLKAGVADQKKKVGLEIVFLRDIPDRLLIGAYDRGHMLYPSYRRMYAGKSGIPLTLLAPTQQKVPEYSETQTKPEPVAGGGGEKKKAGAGKKKKKKAKTKTKASATTMTTTTTTTTREQEENGCRSDADEDTDAEEERKKKRRQQQQQILASYFRSFTPKPAPSVQEDDQEKEEPGEEGGEEEEEDKEQQPGAKPANNKRKVVHAPLSAKRRKAVVG